MSDVCEWSERETPALYVAGRLDEDEEERFEEHLVECAACQAEVRAGLLTREAFTASAMEAPSSAAVGPSAAAAASPPFPRRWVWVPLAAAALAALLLISRPGRDATDLGVVESPPLYYGVAVRNRPGDSLVAEGMQAYSAGRYDDAADLLARGFAVSGDSIPAVFFLGIIDLLQDRPESALSRLGGVRDLGETPYRTEARFYLARALLALDRPREARSELDAVASSEHDLAVEARAILAELDRRGL